MNVRKYNGTIINSGVRTTTVTARIIQQQSYDITLVASCTVRSDCADRATSGVTSLLQPAKTTSRASWGSIDTS